MCAAAGGDDAVLGVAGLVVASVLVLAEGTGQAVRSPSKSALLAGMAVPVGRGRGFAVHKALDQVGAFVGPLLIAGVAVHTGRLWLGFVVLAVPGTVSLILLTRLRRHAPVESAPSDPPQVYATTQKRQVRTLPLPVVYAGAMAVVAVAALATRFACDRVGARVLYTVPVLGCRRTRTGFQ